ncbi:MAG: hypothetical protein H6883_12490 [Rhodobiaceae bacterium]|nr:hypothetical protein [Rhodobiaceae bacterium]MCC0056945.1 hypothetical protein [Rhodobiaceae bacterium]
MNDLQSQAGPVELASGRWGGVRVALPDDGNGLVLKTRDALGRTHGMFLPPGIRCDVVARKARATFTFDRGECIEGRIGWRAKLFHQLSYRLTSRRRYVFVYPTHWIFPVDADSRRRMSRVFGFLHSFNVNLTSPDMLSGRWYRDLADTARTHVERPHSKSLKIAAIAHMHYHEVWPELAATLRSLPAQSQIFITLTPHAAPLREVILSDFPAAHVEVVQNRGRDVLPFLRLHNAGALDEADLVLKIHGKRSDHGAGLVIGDYWRRASYSALAGTPDIVDSIVDRFDADPELGVLGPAMFRLPNNNINEAQALGQNDDATRQLYHLVFGSSEGFKVDFFAGTMFWFRREALAALKNIHKPEELFESEKGLLDGLPEHAFERLLPLIAHRSGYVIADTGDLQQDS